MEIKYSDTEIELLRQWKQKMAGWRWLHYESMSHYKIINARFVHMSIILSTLAGAGGFSTAGTTDDKFGFMKSYIGYIIGATNVIIGLLNSFQRFGKAAEKTELHASAAMQYAMLTRLLNTELSLSQAHMKSDLINSVRQEMDRLLAQSPPIPKKIIDKFNTNFPDIDHKPDVCSELEETQNQSMYNYFRDAVSTPMNRITNMLKITTEKKGMNTYTTDLEYSPTNTRRSLEEIKEVKENEPI
jgi:hypothetical protein